jgi:Holliday junction DNA helicase RuvA
MIGKLRGFVDSYGEDFVVIDVNGVGYVVQCSSRTLQKLGKPGDPATLEVETQVREDAIRLFGFVGAAERDWFRLLQSVQGVGSKVALAILGVLPPNEIAAAVGFQDKAAVARAPGVGPKLAARIVAELKDKAPALAAVDPLAAGLAGAAPAGTPAAAQEAVSALVNLGYARPQAAVAVAAALTALGAAADTAALIRRGLREAG